MVHTYLLTYQTPVHAQLNITCMKLDELSHHDHHAGSLAFCLILNIITFFQLCCVVYFLWRIDIHEDFLW